MKTKMLFLIVITLLFLMNSVGADEAFSFPPAQIDWDIYSIEDLRSIKYNPGLDHNFHLMNDIEITDEYWNPIGSSSSPFTGAFHGNNHTITFAKETAFVQSYGSENSGCGLFGNVYSGRIYDLNLVFQGNLTSDEDNTGALVGMLYGNYNQSTPSSVLVNCTVTANGHSIIGSNNTGGLVGYMINGSIENCSSDISVVSQKNNTGGLAGYVFNGTVVDSSAAGSVNSANNAGGLIGRLNTGIISGSSATGSVSANNSAGGLIGYISDAANISNSSADGSVKPSGEFGNFIGTWRDGYKPEVTDCLYQGKEVTLEPVPQINSEFLLIAGIGVIVLISAVFLLYSRKKG